MPHQHKTVYSGQRLSLSIGALAGGAAILVSSGLTAGMSGRLLTTRLQAQTSGLTTLEVTQLVIGIASSGLSNAEIAEKLNAGPLHTRDNESLEQSSRYARIVMGCADPGANHELTAFYNESDWFKSMIEFIEDETQYVIFIYNISTSTVTTGAVLKINVEHLLRFNA